MDAVISGFEIISGAVESITEKANVYAHPLSPDSTGIHSESTRVSKLHKECSLSENDIEFVLNSSNG